MKKKKVVLCGTTDAEGLLSVGDAVVMFVVTRATLGYQRGDDGGWDDAQRTSGAPLYSRETTKGLLLWEAATRVRGERGRCSALELVRVLGAVKGQPATTKRVRPGQRTMAVAHASSAHVSCREACRTED